MLIIGGCELSLERNPIGRIDVVQTDLDSKMLQLKQFGCNLQVPVRSPTATLCNDKLYIVGGCRGKMDHIQDVQVLDF